jgi:hypothetical protein
LVDQIDLLFGLIHRAIERSRNDGGLIIEHQSHQHPASAIRQLMAKFRQSA